MAQSGSIGRVLPIDRGTYDNNTDYTPMDYLRYLNGTYICKKACKGQAPNTETGESEYWKIIAWDGDGGNTIATRTSVGGIIVGDNLEIEPNGRLSAKAQKLSPATDSVLGGIMVGDNLQINADGKLDAVDTTYSDATVNVSGLMSASDKAKLNGIASGATANVGTITGVYASGGIYGSASSGTAHLYHSSVANNTGYFGDSGNGTGIKTLGYGGSFYVPYFYVNSEGHVQYAYNRTLKLPSEPKAPLNAIRYALTLNGTASISAHTTWTVKFLGYTNSNCNCYSPSKSVQSYGTYLGYIWQPSYSYYSIRFAYDGGDDIGRLFNCDSSSKSVSGTVGYFTVLYIPN